MTSNSFSLDPQGPREMSHGVRGASGKHFPSGLPPLGLPRPEYSGEPSTREWGVRGGGLQPRGTHASTGPLLCPGVVTSIKLLKRRTEMGPPSLNHDLNLTGQN